MVRFITVLFSVFFASFIYAQSPIAQFSANKTTVCAGSPINFTDLSNYFGSPVISTNWDFGEGGQSNATNPTYTYVNAGTYQVLLTVISTTGTDFEPKVGYITVNPNPTANFTTAGSGCTVPFAVTFGNTSTAGAGISYNWDFGNAQSSVLQNPPAVTYNIAGTFPVLLTVTNTNTGCVSSVTKNLVVSNFKSGITSPASGCKNVAVNLTDASTVGANSWSWESGDGQFSNLQNPSFTYSNPGTYTIKLTSQNSISGCSDVTTKSITIHAPPTPSFTATPLAGCAPLSVNFSNTSGNGTFVWDFGNGTTSILKNPPVKIYNSNGLFTVKLTMTDLNGCIKDTIVTNMITVGPPVSDFISDKIDGCAPVAIQFTDQSTSPNPAADPIVSWLWTFGDGTTFNGQNPPAHSYGIGTFDVSLKITTQTGCTVTTNKTKFIQVGMVDNVDFTLFPINECAKKDITFTDLSTISTPHDPSEVKYHWDFGDHGTSTEKDPKYNYPVDTGFFDIEFIVNFRGCRDTLTRTNQIYIKAPISKFVTADLYCNPISFPVVVNVTDNAIAGANSDNVDMIWRWNDGTPDDLLNKAAIFDSDKGNISHSFATYGTYNIKQVVHNYTTGCEDSTEQTIHITSVVPSFTVSNDTVCNNLPLTITSTSVFRDPLAKFHYNMGNGDTLSGDPISYTYTTPGTYTITQTVTNSVGCSDSIKLPGFKVLDPPVANLTADKSAGCLPITANYTNTSSVQGNGVPLASFLWTYPDASTQTTNSLATLTHFDFTTEGLFATTIEATDKFGCKSAPNFAFMFITNPTVDFTMNSVACDLENVTAVNTTTGFGNLTYQWDVDNVFKSNLVDYSNIYDESPSNLYTNVSHDVKLIATDGNGCKDSITKNLKISLPIAIISNVASGATANGKGEYTCPPVFETITDHSTSYGNITNWHWTFGDGKSSTFQNPNNTYIFPGTYTLTLDITNEYGCKADTALVDYLTILGPTGTLNWTPLGDACLHKYQFDATNLHFVDSIVWHLDDGDTIYNSTSFTHVYPIGSFNPTSSLIDSLGCKVTYPMNTIVVSTISISANAGPDQAFCGNSTVLAGNVDPNGTGKWTLISGTGTIVAPNSANSSVTGIGIGVSKYLWTVTNSCDTISDTMSITITDVSTIAIAGPDQHTCLTTATLAGNIALVGVGNWTLVSGSGTITNPLDPLSSLTNLGVGTNKFVWTIGNVCSTTHDTVNIIVETTPTTPIAGLDQKLCPNSTNLNGNTALVGNGNWTLFSGVGTITTPTLETSGITGLGLDTNVFVWTISNSCGTKSDTVKIIRERTPTVANAGPNQTFCLPNTTLAGNFASIGTGFWTLASGAGTITTPTDSLTTVSNLGFGTNKFVWTISNTCASTTDTVYIIRESPPTIPLAGLDQTLCPNSTNLTGNQALIGNGIWTLFSGVGTITSPNLETSGITGLGIGTNKFVWTISNTCAINSDTVVIIRESPPTLANAGPNQTICSAVSLLAGNTATIGTGIWNLASGTGVVTSPNNPTSGVTGLTPGINKFVWTISNTCSSSNDTVYITVESPPTLPIAGPNQQACIPNAVLAGNIPLIGAGLWTLTSGAGTIISPTVPNSNVIGLPLGPNVFTWTISNTCGTHSSNITITGVDAPTTSKAGADQNICTQNTSLHGNKATVGIGAWVLISGTGNITTPSDSLSTVTGLSIGPNVFEWQINSFCGNSSDQVTITVETPPTIAAAGLSTSVCASNTILAANQAIVGTGTWTLGNLGTGTFGNIHSEISTVSNLSIGPNEFIWTISNSCSSSSRPVIITKVIPPTPAKAGNDSTFCSSNGKLKGNFATIGVGRWTVIAGTGNITNQSDSLSTITGMSPGINTFRWTISNICDPVNNFDEVTFTIEDTPTIANAGPDQNPLCNSNITNLAAVPATIGTGVWTLSSGSGNFLSVNDPNTQVTNVGFGVNVYKWTISNTCGTSFDAISIVRFDSPTTALTSPIPPTCINHSKLTGNVAVEGSGSWTIVKGSGNITDITDPISTITNLGIGENIFKWTIFNGCGITDAQVKIVVESAPIKASVGPNQESCGSTAMLDGNSPKSSRGKWTLIKGTGTINEPTDSTSGVSNMDIGISVFRWTVANSCDTSFADLTITNTGLCPDENADKNELIYYVPNTFTPNEDNFNASFQPIFTSGYEPLKYQLLIFDRWGELLFESHNANIGWKGTYGTNGRIVEDGVYTWKINYTDINTQKEHTIVGHVVMIR